MRKTVLPLFISFTPVMESKAGIPARSGSRGLFGLGARVFVLLAFFFDPRAISCFLFSQAPQVGKVIFVIGWTSQTVGMRLFKLFGPGRDPEL